MYIQAKKYQKEAAAYPGRVDALVIAMSPGDCMLLLRPLQVCLYQ